MAIIKSKQQKKDLDEPKLTAGEQDSIDNAKSIKGSLKDANIIKKKDADQIFTSIEESSTFLKSAINQSVSDEIVELSAKGDVRFIKKVEPELQIADTEDGVPEPIYQGPTPEEILQEAQEMREEAKDVVIRAKDDAGRIITEAQNKAKKLIEECKLYCQSIESTSGREGFELGKDEGRKAGFEEVANLVEETRRTLHQAFGERDRLMKSVEAEAAKLALKIAERIIGTEISMRPDIVLDMVSSTIEKVKDREHVIIYVHQEDLEYVKENAATFGRIVDGIKSFEIQADPRVDRGGCIIETNLGSVDARINTKLAAIETAFKDVEELKGEEDALD